jgi:hypothetical protein
VKKLLCLTTSIIVGFYIRGRPLEVAFDPALRASYETYFGYAIVGMIAVVGVYASTQVNRWVK